jgi:hypothetical protein
MVGPATPNTRPHWLASLASSHLPRVYVVSECIQRPARLPTSDHTDPLPTPSAADPSRPIHPAVEPERRVGALDPHETPWYCAHACCFPTCTNKRDKTGLTACLPACLRAILGEPRSPPRRGHGFGRRGYVRVHSGLPRPGLMSHFTGGPLCIGPPSTTARCPRGDGTVKPRPIHRSRKVLVICPNLSALGDAPMLGTHAKKGRGSRKRLPSSLERYRARGKARDYVVR